MEIYSTGKKSPPSFRSLPWKFFLPFTKKKKEKYFPLKMSSRHVVVLVEGKKMCKEKLYVSSMEDYEKRKEKNLFNDR